MLFLFTKLFSLPEYDLKFSFKKITTIHLHNYVNSVMQDFPKCASVSLQPTSRLLLQHISPPPPEIQNLIWNYRATTSVLIPSLLEGAISGFTHFSFFATSETLGNDQSRALF